MECHLNSPPLFPPSLPFLLGIKPGVLDMLSKHWVLSFEFLEEFSESSGRTLDCYLVGWLSSYCYGFYYCCLFVLIMNPASSLNLDKLMLFSSWVSWIFVGGIGLLKWILSLGDWSLKGLFSVDFDFKEGDLTSDFLFWPSLNFA